jgi:hypothetical protein
LHAEKKEGKQMVIGNDGWSDDHFMTIVRSWEKDKRLTWDKSKSECCEDSARERETFENVNNTLTAWWEWDGWCDQHWTLKGVLKRKHRSQKQSEGILRWWGRIK